MTEAIAMTDEDRLEVKIAMFSLSESDFTEEGKPSPAVIESMTGVSLTEGLRDELWAEIDEGSVAAKRTVTKLMMLNLDPATDFTRSGVPSIEAMEAALGFQIDGQLRDELWMEVEAEMATDEPHPEGEPYLMVRIPGIRLQQALDISKAIGVSVGARNVHVLQDKAISVNIDDDTADDARTACVLALTLSGFADPEKFVKSKRSHIAR